MVKQSLTLALVMSFLLTSALLSQSLPDDKVVSSPEMVGYYTYEWDGERLPDGRPKVSDDLLERLKEIKVEDVWQLLNELGYKNQFDAGWEMIHDDVPIVGRVLTAHYMPRRPDVQNRLVEEGLDAGHVGPQNSWPIDLLQEGDVYLTDTFGKIAQGTMIGDKLGNSIFAKTGTGVIFDGSLRDVETLADLEGFNAFARGFHPTFLDEVMLMGINVPVRIGQVSVMPGDVVLAKRMGVVFIPPHLVEQVVITAEIVQLRDEFVHERVQQGVYTPGQVDTRWTEEIEQDFLNWLEDGHMDRLPVPLDQMQDFLQTRTW